MKKSIYLLIIYSALGNFIDLSFFTCLPVYLLKENTGLYAGFSFSLMSLIGILFLPIIGSLIDKYNKKRLLQGTALSLSSLFLAYSFFPEEAIFILSPFVLIFLNFQSSTVKASLPLLVNSSELLHFNALKNSLDTLAVLLAPAISLWIFSILSFYHLLTLLGFLVFFNLIIASFLPPLSKRVDSEKSSFQEIKESLKSLAKDQPLVRLVVLFMALNFFIGGLEEIIYPVILLHGYKMKEKFLGLSLSCTSLGAIIAGLSLMKKSSSKDYSKDIFSYIKRNAYLMIFLGGISFIVSNKIHYFLIFCLFQLAIGFYTSRVNVPLETTFQKRVHRDQQGKFFSFLAFSSRILVPLGILYSGFLVDLIGGGQTLMINNLFIIILVYVFTHHMIPSDDSKV